MRHKHLRDLTSFLPRLRNISTLKNNNQNDENVLRPRNINIAYVHFHLVNGDCQHSLRFVDILVRNKRFREF